MSANLIVRNRCPCHSSTSDCNKLNNYCDIEVVSKTCFVNKYLQSITENQKYYWEWKKKQSPKKLKSPLYNNVKIDKLQEQSLLKQITNEISAAVTAKSKDDNDFSCFCCSHLKEFLATVQPGFCSSNIILYKAYEVLHIDGSPLLLVITNVSVYVVGIEIGLPFQFKLALVILFEELAAVIISPFTQLLLLIRDGDKYPTYIINSAAEYGIAREIVAFLEIAMRRWAQSNSKSFSFSAAEITSHKQMQIILNVEFVNIFTEEEQILFQSCIWLQEEDYIMNMNPLGPQKEGYLMCRFGDFNNCSWNSCYIRLKGNVLYVFENILERIPKMSIELCSGECKSCKYSTCSNRPHTFELILKNNTRCLFGAANEIDMLEWLHYIVAAISYSSKINDILTYDRGPYTYEEFYILITNLQLVLYKFPNKISKRCSLTNIINLRRTTQTECFFCLLEFDCKEASETGGDWILHFVSEKSCQAFCSELLKLKPNLFSECDLDIENDWLFNQCSKVNYKIQSSWNPFIINKY